MKIKSGTEQLFSEKGRLKELADDFYFPQMDKLKKDITEWFRSQIKKVFYNTMSNEEVFLKDSTSLSIHNENNSINLVYTIPVRVEFLMSDRDVEKSQCYLDYYVIGSFAIIQNKTAESIRFTNPTWTVTRPESKITITRKEHRFLATFFADTRAHFNDFVKSMPSSDFRRLFIPLNSIKNSFNDYIQASVINNPDLQKEFEIDETRTLAVTAVENSSSLIFTHRHSPAGIVKRNVKTNPAGIKDGAESANPNPVPVTTSPAGATGGRDGQQKPPPGIKIPKRKNQR